MSDYSFDVLNDKEFEILIVDLLSEHLNTSVERFKSGRDKGVDGRFFPENGGEGIVQCKHYLKSGYSSMIKELEKNEVKKVIDLNPTRYIFATSIALSRVNKQEIKKIFTPYIQSENDILGNEDINDLLKKNPKIEENHYKLWLSSTTVLNRLLNNAIKGRSKSILNTIREKLHLYVTTENHIKAINLLRQNHTVIITGEPGIGKSTLAENLCYFYFRNEYELCVIQNSIKEAEDIYLEDTKQVFFFDDFLGSNFLLAIENNIDNQITQFIQRIKNDHTKRFILTSRTNIMNQGLLLSDTFLNKKINKNELLLNVQDLSEMDKAHILYNHLWFSKLNLAYIAEIYQNKRYKQIIKHKNFNPRIIEYITDHEKAFMYPPDKYWDYIKDTLNNPKDIWANIFNIQSDDFIRHLVVLTVFNKNQIEEDKLKDAYNILNQLMNTSKNTHISKDFDTSIKIAVKIFLNRTIFSTNDVRYTLFNPSIADFVINKYKNDVYYLQNIFLSLKTEKSLIELKSLYKNDFITFEVFKNILLKLYDEATFDTPEKQKYFRYLISIFNNNNLLSETIITKILCFVEYIFENTYSYLIDETIIEVISYLLDNQEMSEITAERLLFLVISTPDSYIEDINALLVFIKKINFNLYSENIYNDIVNILNKKVEENLINSLDSFVSDLDLNDYFEGFDYDGSVEIDEYNLENHIRDELTNMIEELENFDDLNIDESYIFHTIDLYEIINNFNPDYSIGSDEDNYKSYKHANMLDNIDELFAK